MSTETRIIAFAAATLIFTPPALAADQKISAMSAGSALTGTETLPAVQGGGNIAPTAQAVANLWVHGSPFSYTLPFGSGFVLANGTLVIEGSASCAGVVQKAVYSNGSGGGTTTLAVQIGTTSITGLSAVTVSAQGTSSASGANTIALGGTLRDVFSSTSGTISDGGYVTVSGTCS